MAVTEDLILNFTPQDLDRIIEEAEEDLVLQKIKSPEAFLHEILQERVAAATSMPWENTHGQFDLRAGEFTLWAGESGSGKSMILGQVISHVIAQGYKAVIASMEMKPHQTLRRMLGQCAGVPIENIGETFVSNWLKWATGKLWLYDKLDTVASDLILRLIKAVSYKLSVQHIVIDSLVKCGLPQDGGNWLSKQTDFCDQLQHLAKHLDIHIHLVCHLRKPDSRSHNRATKYDIRGASQISDLADNVILLSRNRTKEEVLAKREDDRDEDDLEALDEPDVYMEIAKQRHHPVERVFGLDYLRDSNQFVTPGRKNPMTWPRGSAILPWAIQQSETEQRDNFFEDFDE